jgi:uncharacterized protein (DUF58 family)
MNFGIIHMASRLGRFARLAFIVLWLGVLYLIASNIQAGWLFVVIALFVMVAAVSVFFPMAMVRGVSAAMELPRHTERGAVCSATLTVANRARARRAMIRIECANPDFQFVPRGVFFTVLDPGETRSVPVRYVCARRGSGGPGAFVISCAAPLGIFSVRRLAVSDAETLTHPRLAPSPGRELLKEYGLHDPGPAQRRLSAPDPYHYTLREYSAGDSLRDIHWKLTARMGAPIVRVRERKITGRASVLIDNLRASWPPDAEQQFEAMLERGLAAVRALLFDFGYTVTVHGTAAPAITLQSEAEWERALEWFALTELRERPGVSEYGQWTPADAADVSMCFGVTDSAHAADKAQRDAMN